MTDIDKRALALRSEDLEDSVRLAEVGEFLFNSCRYSAGNGYTEPREMGIDWQWQQSAPDQYGDEVLLATATKWHDEQAEDGVITEARKLRYAIATILREAVEANNDFNIGYTLACSNLVNLHGEPGMAADVMAQVNISWAEKIARAFIGAALEEAANICDDADGSAHPADLAATIRTLLGDEDK